MPHTNNIDESFIALATRVTLDSSEDWRKALREMYTKATNEIFRGFCARFDNVKVFPAAFKTDNGMLALALFFAKDIDEANLKADESGLNGLVKSPAFSDPRFAVTRMMNTTQMHGMLKEACIDIPIINTIKGRQKKAA
jgi:hypothetical protein